MGPSSQKWQHITFLEECQKYIEIKVQTAVQERRHAPVVDGEIVTYMVTALNARTLYEDVVKQYPEGIAIPSKQWLKWQFWPRHAGKLSAKRYSGRIKVRYMVQARQFWQSHVDCYYASALWRYQKEFAIKFREHASFIYISILLKSENRGCQLQLLSMENLFLLRRI